MNNVETDLPNPSFEERCLTQVREALQGRVQAMDLPEGWQALLNDLSAIRQFTRDLSQGDLSGELCVDGPLANDLKELQSSLRHLTWQVQQVAHGDYTQQVTFMGEFSAALREVTQGLRRARAEEREQRVLAEALRDTAAALNSALGLDEIIDIILDNVGRVVPHDTLDIFLVTEDGKARIARCSGYDQITPGLTEQVKDLELLVESTPNLRLMTETGQPCLVNDLGAFDWVHVVEDRWARAYLGAPIRVDGQVVGFLSLMSAQAGFFNSQQAGRLMVFADQIAVAIQKVRLIERLQEQATIDGLTCLTNRRTFIERAEYEFERIQRYAGTISAFMLDIDRFKQINDTYGHAAGDAVLHRVAEVCMASLRKVDLLGRYGGEEFTALLPETGQDEALETAERLCRAICALRFNIDGREFQVTVSLGVAESFGAEDNVAHLLDRADQAMYRAKQRGRNQVAAFR